VAAYIPLRWRWRTSALALRTEVDIARSEKCPGPDIGQPTWHSTATKTSKRPVLFDSVINHVVSFSRDRRGHGLARRVSLNNKRSAKSPVSSFGVLLDAYPNRPEIDDLSGPADRIVYQRIIRSSEVTRAVW
jgi:hypothetical protein